MNREAIINDMYFRLGRMPTEDEINTVAEMAKAASIDPVALIRTAFQSFSIGIHSYEMNADEAKRAMDALCDKADDARKPQPKTRTFYDWRFRQWKR